MSPAGHQLFCNAKNFIGSPILAARDVMQALEHKPLNYS